MPPDPILGLLAFVGVLTYVMVGVIVGVLTVRIVGENPERMKKLSNWDTKQYPREPGQEAGAMSPVWAVVWLTALWPAWLGLLVAAGSVVAGGAVVYGVGWVLGWSPVWLIKHIGAYIAAMEIVQPKEAIKSAS